jgi:hypothetical protein
MAAHGDDFLIVFYWILLVPSTKAGRKLSGHHH